MRKKTMRMPKIMTSTCEIIAVDSGMPSQVGNWLECVRSGKETICPAEVGHRSASICHLANIGYRLRRALRWDPAKEKFVDDAEADKLLDREPRAPWRL